MHPSSPPRSPSRRALPLLLLPLLLGANCSENEFIEQPYDSIAVVTGDFDYVEASLNRLDVAYFQYEGYICCAAYDPEIDPEVMSLKAENLFYSEDAEGRRELDLHDVVFINSGARGFGEYAYNGVDPDDTFVSDPELLAYIQEAVESRGKVLVVSDWSYDLVEAIWPEAITFYGDVDSAPGALDAAQVGVPGRLTAQVLSQDLKNALAQPTVSLEYNYSYWTVMEDVGPETTVHLRGDAEVRLSDSEGYGSMPGVPLLVSFEAGSGKVIVASFHWDTQTAALTDSILVTLIDRLAPASATPAQSTADAGGEGESDG